MSSTQVGCKIKRSYINENQDVCIFCTYFTAHHLKTLIELLNDSNTQVIQEKISNNHLRRPSDQFLILHDTVKHLIS